MMEMLGAPAAHVACEAGGTGTNPAHPSPLFTTIRFQLQLKHLNATF